MHVTTQPNSDVDVSAKIPRRLLYSVPEVAVLLGLSQMQIWRLVKSGDLHSVKQGRRRCVEHAEIDRYIDRLRMAAAIEREQRPAS